MHAVSEFFKATDFLCDQIVSSNKSTKDCIKGYKSKARKYKLRKILYNQFYLKGCPLCCYDDIPYDSCPICNRKIEFLKEAI